jgi:hypothetical protein
MAKSTVVVGCKLPNGIILGDHEEPKKQFTLNGLNRANIIGAAYATTEVDAELWDAWYSVNKDFPAVKSGSIFQASNDASVKSIAREYKDRKTGFEPLDPKAHGVKPADKD